jgi:Carboxypeptidase regulatory-like domain
MNRKLRNVLTVVAACLALVWCIPSVGQVVKGAISGTVVDPQGAVISGAQVKATNLATGIALTTTSDSSGLFRFNLIPAGEYKVEVSAQGFKTAAQSNVAVIAGRDSGVGAIKLTVGERSETVEVTAAAPLIETSQAQVTNTFAGTALSTFAGIQENQGLDNLALFMPGIVSVRDNSFSNTNGGLGFSSNGLRGRNNDQQIDGQNNNDNSVGGPGLFVSDTEFVQQYVLITNQFGPEYGRNAGSVVNIITKSGSNAWHGSIYENENNSVMNSMSNFQKRFVVNPDGSHLTEPTRLNDEFGGFTVGGPLVKNKAFFFGGFDQEIFATVANFHSDSLSPTPAGLATLAGCFPGSQTLQTWSKFGPFGISAGNPVPTPVPLNPTDPNSQRSFILLQVPNSGFATTCDNVQFGGVSRFLSSPFHGFNFVNRLDYQRGSDNFMARYLFNRGNNFNNDFGDAAAGYPVSVPALSQAILLGWTHNLSSRMVNEARVGFDRLNVDFGTNTIGTVPSAGQVDQAVARVTFRFPSAFLSPGTNFTSPFFPNDPFLGIGTATNLPQSRIVNTWQAQDNWNYVVGKHTFKAGVNYTFQRSPNVFLPAINGAFRFDSWGDVGTGRTFIDNQPQRVQIASGTPSLDFREHDTFAYGGDDWKIGSNLTLNLGLTWSYYGQPANLFNDITVPRESNPATALWNPALPLSVRTFPKFPAPKNSFGPSLGFAYNPQWGGFLTGHGKTTFRGGYRLLYDPPFYNIYINMSSSSPEVFLQTFQNSAAKTKPLPLVPTGPNVRASLSSFITPGVFDPRTFAETTIAPKFGPDKVQSWSFGLEREVTKNSAVEVRYSGNHGQDLFQSLNANPNISALAADFPSLIPAGVTPCATSQLVGPGAGVAVGRVHCDQGILRSRDNTGFSNYHALQAEFRANNLFKQLTIRTGYSFSKNLDNVSEIFSTFGGANSNAFAQNILKPGSEYSFSGLDIPHQWTILFTEELPFFKEQHGFVGHLLGGWGFSGNYVLASGQRYTPSQFFISEFSANDYFDSGFYNSFNGGAEPARPFIGNLKAAATAVGIFAGDACPVFASVGTEPICTMDPNTLISLNALNAKQAGLFDVNGNPVAPVVVQKDQVRFIANGGTADKVFGTPFGNAARNIVTDAITNTANFSVFKRMKFTERASFEFHASALNAFNHPNFQSIDPFLEDAGLGLEFTGFGDPTVTNTTVPGSNGGTRRITVGGVFRF